MNSADKGSSESLIAEIYQSIEQLSIPEKAALAQHLISTNELTVVVSSRATVGNALESIAEQVRRLKE